MGIDIQGAPLFLLVSQLFTASCSVLPWCLCGVCVLNPPVGERSVEGERDLVGLVRRSRLDRDCTDRVRTMSVNMSPTVLLLRDENQLCVLESPVPPPVTMWRLIK